MQGPTTVSSNAHTKRNTEIDYNSIDPVSVTHRVMANRDYLTFAQTSWPESMLTLV